MLLSEPPVKMSDKGNGVVVSSLEAKRAELKKVQALAEDAGSWGLSSLEKEVTEAEVTIEKLGGEIDALRAREDENVEALQFLKDEKISLEEAKETKIKELEDDVARCTSHKEKASAEYEELLKRNQKEEQALAEKVKKEKDLLDAQTKKNQEEMRQAQVEAGVAPLETSVQKLMAEIEAKSAKYKEDTALLERTKANKLQFETELETILQQTAELTAEHEAKFQIFKSEGEKHEAEANSITNETNQRIDESTQTKNKIQKSEEELKEEERKINDLKETKEKSEAKQKELKEKAQDLKREELRMKKEIEKIEKNLALPEKEEDEKRKMLAKKEAALRIELAKKTKEFVDIQAQYKTQMNAEVANAKTKVTEAVRDDIKDQESQLETLKGDNEQLRIRIRALEKALTTERKKMKDITEKKTEKEDW